ncbi:MAG: class I SAM-dependent methyltransferase [Saprospiraceae bacterium]|nr:class I SAM-dependent methyltransferase [Saprospiraceae bacterium]
MKAIRHLYEEHGAENYYRDHADSYANPHFPQIAALIQANLAQINHAGGVLDFCSGGGEVSLALAALGVGNITGCDPFTFDLYEKNTGRPCLRYSFKDVIKGVPLGQYSTIICSFAMHLCPAKDLFSLCWQLFQAAPQLVIITPHKRPELDQIPGIRLVSEDSAFTEKEKRVRLRIYEQSEE